MTRTWSTLLLVSALMVTGARASRSQAPGTKIEPMPSRLEIEYALSALPKAMRHDAAVFVLQPTEGYHLARQGTSGVTCLVERTAWEQADFRNDIYVPLCYDAEGTHTYLKVIMDAAALRGQGMSPTALKQEIEARYARGIYKVPSKVGVSYMTAPVMRTWMLPDWHVHTMPMPHLMFYAPNMTSQDIGAVPASGLAYPIVFKEGIPEQTYIVELIGQAERTRIVADERQLLEALCSYRAPLCISQK